MKKTEKLFRELKNNRLVALLAPDSPEQCLDAYEIFQPHGIVLEITFRSEYALQGIRMVLEKHPDALIMAGTVLSADQASEAITAGASGIVSADFFPDVVDICQDKRKTYRFLVRNGFDTASTASVRSALSNKKLNLPFFLKPSDGYASRGTAVVKNRKELSFFAKRIPNCIVQEFIKGTEHTCDVYVDFNMKVRCVVPRKRIEVRAGEVSKGQIVKDRYIMNESARLVERLGAGPGVITLQLFLTEDDRVKFIEVNPRFGGGVPLSIKAGANFPKWLLKELLGKKANISSDGFKDNLIMLRYDGEVWFENAGAKRAGE